MIRDQSLSSKLLDVVVHAVVIIVLIVTIYPVLYVLSASLSSPEAYNLGKVTIFPVDVTMKAYRLIWEAKTVPRSFLNSVVYTTLGTAISMLLTTSLAYAISRKKLALRRYYMWFVLITMYFNGGMITNFLLVKNLGLYNTLWAIVLPTAVSTYYLIIMRSYFQAVPEELNESAYLDGANDLIIFIRITLPLSMAALVTIGLFYAVNYWNAWFSSLLYLKDTDKYPLQMVLRQIIIRSELLMQSIKAGEASASEMASTDVTSIKYATLFVSIGPMMILYPFIQKYFVKGVMIGSLKG
ncbi:putative aldouronate transport system permease protein [Paenibacillus sp. UNCCL117]|uniref:carbohydrate ABC transporter permease n=1 Tax=unclassified Paenibacillus TaxID=185978 RepID=UPI00087EE142|nr:MULTISPECIES: carbohydrate ABC transporter permease [unclassified Paenibacillus]SDD14482.1 putative aldouronate transport system permease protein [Paenibacillus sp. cl123]SFW34230.1 putative aldouronate transport system permease protein [Paenibacillus sp. UNCCL117]